MHDIIHTGVNTSLRMKPEMCGLHRFKIYIELSSKSTS